MLSLCLIGPIGTSCGGRAPGAESAEPSGAVQRYRLRGEVEDFDGRRLRIRHQAIDPFTLADGSVGRMEAMSMWFGVDQALRGGGEVPPLGSTIDFELIVEWGASTAERRARIAWWSPAEPASPSSGSSSDAAASPGEEER
ncbi:MAG: hypothetical protein DWQ36_11440 [Acidobacteria bacterium]|nr:MAG: hypothetical protein DWQ30_17305 [Acidobacteriota bacterium]REK07818.1 MAG: hypothetical protein DWQ36_11440 [Acidobacteriota bacterium]